jgi:hypothetical protein
MLVCNVSLRPPRRTISVDLAEVVSATDATATGNVIFATLVDDPASVLDHVDAYSGEIMLEAATAADGIDAGLAYAAAMAEDTTAVDAWDGSVPTAIVSLVDEVASAVDSSTAAIAPPLDGISGVTTAVSASRNLLTAYGGSYYNLTSGKVDTAYDQSGAARNLTQTIAANRPAVISAGPNSRDAFDFNQTNQQQLIGVAISNLITASAGYVIIGFIVDTIATNSATIYQNNAVWGDAGGFVGTYLKSAPTASAFNWDGNADVAPSAGAAIATGTAYVIEWRHESGNLYQRINGGSWSAATVSGNTSTLTGLLHLGAGAGSTSYLDGKIFECITFNTVPSTTVQDTLAGNMKNWVGA